MSLELNGTHQSKGSTKLHFFKDPQEGHWRWQGDGMHPDHGKAVDWVSCRNKPAEPDVIIRWTDIREALPPRTGWCLVKRSTGLGGYGITIRDAWFDGKVFTDGTPAQHVIEMIDFSEELWGDSAGIIGWAYLYRHYLTGGWQQLSKQTWKDGKEEP